MTEQENIELAAKIGEEVNTPENFVIDIATDAFMMNCH